MADIVDGSRDARGEWQPKELPRSPIFRWPFNPKAFLAWFYSPPIDGHLFFVVKVTALALLVWYFLTPDLEQMRSLRIGPIALIFLRNVGLLTIYVGRLHWRLYIRKAQGMKYKYTNKWPSTDSKRFLFNNQTLDNVFWSIASGCVVWTIYEVFMLWGYANDLLPRIDFRSSPVLFGVILLLHPLYHRVHFYLTHRLIHWPPLYRTVHHVHHRNTNFGPWSGLSMHPVEHLIFFSDILIYLIVPVHPIIILFGLIRNGISPASGHAGFHRYVKNTGDGAERNAPTYLVWNRGADYFHHLHHRFFTVNFGSTDLPLDWWFGTGHDGSPEDHAAMMAKRRRRRAAAPDISPE